MRKNRLQRAEAKAIVTIVAALGLWCTPLLAGSIRPVATEALPPLPEVHVPRTAAGMQVDGKWGGKWENAASVSLHAYWQREGEPAPEPSEVRLCYDDRFLYVGFRCIDREIVASRSLPDDQTYRDDCVEVFMAADRERRSDALGVEISVTGAVADFYYRHSEWFHYGWNSEAQVKTSRTMDGFVVEMALPWKSILPGLGLPERGEALRANFGRWDQTPTKQPSRLFTLWSHSGLSFPSPHQPERYGRLIFD